MNASEPPPAPIVCTSSDGTRMGSPSTVRSPAGAGRPSSTRHTSVDVPAHVERHAVRKAGGFGRCRGGEYATCRSRQQQSHRRCGAVTDGDEPSRRGEHEHGRRQRRKPLEVAPADRSQVGVGDGRRQPFVLAVLRRHLVAACHVDSPGPEARQRPPARVTGLRSLCSRQTATASTPSGIGGIGPTGSTSTPSASSRPAPRADARGRRAATAGEPRGHRETADPAEPISIRSAKPSFVTSATHAPRRSSSAFVATVVPCASTSTGRSADGIGDADDRIVRCRRHLGDRAVRGDEVGERPAGVDPDSGQPTTSTDISSKR